MKRNTERLTALSLSHAIVYPVYTCGAHCTLQMAVKRHFSVEYRL